ncbi:MAG: helix-turn-helix transcriptional regulator [Polyangiaceae bacterium]
MPVRKNQAWRSDARGSKAVGASLRRLGKRLRSLREAAGLTQVQVAEKAALDDKHYQTMESGLSNVTFATLVAVAKALGVTLAELFEGV